MVCKSQGLLGLFGLAESCPLVTQAEAMPAPQEAMSALLPGAWSSSPCRLGALGAFWGVPPVIYKTGALSTGSWGLNEIVPLRKCEDKKSRYETEGEECL